jgi:HK97 family phage portal protein
MTARALVARSLRTVLRAVEGAYRPGPYYLSVSGGWLPDGVPNNWWQTGITPLGDFSRTAMVEACVSAYSQTIAMCPGSHWRMNGKGGRKRITNTSLSRVLKTPNAYQSISDFLLNAVRSLYIDGNAYALALRNSRFEVTELHLMRPEMCYARVATTGDIFYTLGGNNVIDPQVGTQYIVPERDVLHMRLHANRRFPYPLIGESPLVAAMADINVNNAIADQQAQFYANQARPSAVLLTEQPLSADQVQQLRDRWDEQTRGINQGKTPILTHGLKVDPWNVTGRDAQIAEMAKLSAEHIALVFRVPLQVLGLGGTTFGSTEALMQFWVSTGLGFAINHVEQSFDRLFGLEGEPEEYVEFSTEALMRSAMKDRIEALTRGVQGGIYSPNEARNQEGLDDVKAGDEPRVQQQVVPLSAAEAIQPESGKGSTGPHPPPAPGPEAPPAAPPAPKKEPAAPKKDQSDVVKREFTRLLAATARASRRYN